MWTISYQPASFDLIEAIRTYLSDLNGLGSSMCGMLMVRLIQTSQYLNNFESCAAASCLPAKWRNNEAGEQHYDKFDAISQTPTRQPQVRFYNWWLAQ
jgi:hypothetical protein